MAKETRSLFPQVEQLLKLLLVVPASFASAERSFSMLRRVKTYLRSTMTQKRLNHVCVLNSYPERLDTLSVDRQLKSFVIRLMTIDAQFLVAHSNLAITLWTLASHNRA
mgnify:FL=1